MLALTEWAEGGVWEAVEVDVEVHASAVGIGCGGNIAADRGAITIRQVGSIGDADWVVGSYGGVAKFTGRTRNNRPIECWRPFDQSCAWRLRMDESEA